MCTLYYFPLTNKEIDSLKLSYAIDSALSKTGVKGGKVARTLLDMEKIKLEDGKVTGLACLIRIFQKQVITPSPVYSLNMRLSSEGLV
ncbi:MAG: phage scaffolding protein [Candidatus Ornithomonoglobus sp.]